MTVKEELHRLVDHPADDQTELAGDLLQNLSNAADADAEPLGAEWPRQALGTVRTRTNLVSLAREVGAWRKLFTASGSPRGVI